MMTSATLIRIPVPGRPASEGAMNRAATAVRRYPDQAVEVHHRAATGGGGCPRGVVEVHRRAAAEGMAVDSASRVSGRIRWVVGARFITPARSATDGAGIGMTFPAVDPRGLRTGGRDESRPYTVLFCPTVWASDHGRSRRRRSWRVFVRPFPDIGQQAGSSLTPGPSPMIGRGGNERS